MARELVLPELGENITSGIVVKVLVKVGDSVEEGQPVIELETDKAVVEVPAEAAGVISAVYVKEGEEIQVGQPIVSLESSSTETAPQEVVSQIPPEPEATPKDDLEKETTPPVEHQPETAPVTTVSSAAAPAAPNVRRFAREIGVDINSVPGTGPGGRISVDDVKAYAKQRSRVPQPAHAPITGGVAEPLPDFSQWGEVERQPMSMVRRKTAAHLAHAWSTIPHVTHFDEADITALESFRKTHGVTVEAAGGKLTLTGILLKIVAAALKRFPQFNAAVDIANNAIIYKKYYNIGVAVDTERGLLVPVVRAVNEKSITALCVELTRLARRARSKKLTIEEMQGGNFTISNLGGIGGTAFTPIIHSPEVAILGVSKGQTKARYRNGHLDPRLILPMSLSYDHRIIDGADAARFLTWIVRAIEQPLLLSLEG
jgi:pyruvate dehydrogenase E2 component (dihydrolipoamide acetyltransferase)